MDLLTLQYRPDQSSYAAEDSAEEILRAQLSGGAGRYRLDILNGSKLINCRWTLDGEAYDYMRTFYRVFTADVRPFWLDLIIEEQRLAGCKCWFIPKSFKLAGIEGNIYEIAAQIEAVLPDIYDVDADRNYLIIVDVFGVEWYLLLDRLHEVLHVEAPGVTNIDEVFFPEIDRTADAFAAALGLMPGVTNYQYP